MSMMRRTLVGASVAGPAILWLGACRSFNPKATEVGHMKESLDEFRRRLEAATLAMMNGDDGPWTEVYSHAPDATLFGGWGGHEKGWEQLAQRWKMVAGRWRRGTLEIERIAEHLRDDMAVTVEMVRGDAAFSDGSAGRFGLR